MYLNRATIYGNLTKDPEVKALPSGIKVANVSMATNRTYKDQSGAKKEQVEYHNVVAFGKQAELIAQYCKKGNPLYIEGRIQTRSWDDAGGQKKYRTEIIVENFQFGPKGTSSGTYNKDTSQNQDSPSQSSGKDTDVEYPSEDENLEEIPF